MLVACQKLTKPTNVLRSYSKNKSGTFFIETWCSISGKISYRWVHEVPSSEGEKEGHSL